MHPNARTRRVNIREMRATIVVRKARMLLDWLSDGTLPIDTGAALVEELRRSVEEFEAEENGEEDGSEG